MDTQYKEFLSNFAELELLSRQFKSSTYKEYDLMVKNHQSLIENASESRSSSFTTGFPIGG